ncbi:hypothetical protein Tco_0774946 [Tanacetum coccineum]|uniref:Uncharacterized protein n=1 Tax=Tanacetum coccineum TaxID=301880 RepID=A0ABQ4ZPX4_9ASTR
MKILIIKKGEYDIWSLRIRQYICHTDHNLWDVIVNRDIEEEPALTEETSAPPTKQLAAKRNQQSVKIILLLAIPDEYLLKFYNVADAKSLWEVIKSRFGDKAYDRFQKLISQLEVHGAPISKEDINQKFLRSLPLSWNQISLIMRNKPDIDELDIDDLYNNLRVYEDEMKRSSSSTSTSHNLAFLSSKNTSSTNEVSTASGDFGIDEDDLEELDLRWQVAMLTVRVNNATIVTEKGIWLGNADLERIKGEDLCDQVRSNAPTNKSSITALWIKMDKENYDSEREKHSKARLEIQGYELALESLESRILVHEKNELAWGEKYEFQNYELKCREIKINNLNLELEKVVKERDDLKLKIEKWEESSKNLDELLNNQMSARDKTGLGYGIQLNEMSNNSEIDSEISLSVFDVRSSDEENTPANDRFSKEDGFHVVPPPIIGNFLTTRADISFAGLDEYAIRKKIIDSKITDLNTKISETIGKTNEANTQKPKTVYESFNRYKVIIKDWNSDDEDDVSKVQSISLVKTNESQTVKTRVDKISQTSQKQGIRFKKIKACFACKSTDHLIKDRNFHDKQSQEPKLKSVINIGLRVDKLVWDNAKRVNHQFFSNKLKYPHLRKTFVPSEVLTRTGLIIPVKQNEKRAVHTISTTRSVSTARSVCTARPDSIVRPFAPKIAQTIGAIRPIYKNGQWQSRDLVIGSCSGCSSHMTGNKAYLSDYENFN